MVSKSNRPNVLGLLLVVAAFVATAAVYHRLPQRVPSHWNAAGRVDGYASKPWGPFLMPLTMTGLALLFAVVRRVSRRGVETFRGALVAVEAATQAFFLLITIVMLRAGLGEPISMNRVVSVGAGLLFVVVGNFMGKFTRNFFVGIRTPWTLASDEVWLRTHRLGGKVWVAGGLVIAGLGLYGASLTVEGGVLAVMTGVPLVYSYLLHRRLQRGAPT